MYSNGTNKKRKTEEEKKRKKKTCKWKVSSILTVIKNTSKVDTDTILKKWSLKTFQELKKTAVANWNCHYLAVHNNLRQLPRGVFSKSYSENMQQIYRKTSMLKCDFNKISKQLYWNHTSAWVLSVNLLHISRTPFYQNACGGLLLSNNFNVCQGDLIILDNREQKM